MWVRTWPLTASSYGARGVGNRGDGERAHRHTITQTFRVVRGLALVTLEGDELLLAPASRPLFAPSGTWHGLVVLADGTEYESIFAEADGRPVDGARIRREQVPSLTPAEAEARRAQLDRDGYPRTLAELQYA
jgi:hypothetical protein